MLIFRAVRNRPGPAPSGVVVVAAVSFLVLVWAAQGRVPGAFPGVVAGLFVSAAAAAALAGWRSPSNPVSGWPVFAGITLAAQALALTLFGLQLPADAATSYAALMAITVAGLLVVVLALTRVDRRGEVVDDCLGVGIGMGMMAAAYVVPQLLLAAAPPLGAEAVAGGVVATHVAALALVVRLRLVGPAAQWLLASTVLAVAVGLLVEGTGLHGTAWAVAATAAKAAIGAAWFVTAYCCVSGRRAEARRRTEEMDDALRFIREHRETLHELRSTLAGLVNGSALLDRPEIPPVVRERLWISVRRELDRMSRLVSDQEQAPVDLDLDQSLDLILDLQRLKGRHVELRGSGESVRAHHDSLAEVLNILLDNAVTHGGTETSVVEVVRRDDDTVDIEVTDFGRGIPQDQRQHLFDWGRRGNDSPGEGIGLHVARRLVAEDGGSLDVREVPHAGSSFVISLPRARQSSENLDTTGVSRAGRQG